MGMEDKQAKDEFDTLVTQVIEAFKITLNDSVALDAHGIIGKMRVMIVDSERYQRETRRIRAQQTIADLQEIDRLIDTMKEPEEEDEEAEGEPDETYDIRGTNKTDVKTKRTPPRFDKARMETRLKLLSARKDVLMSSKEGEDRETDALNIFFIAMSREEFEAMETVEISEGTRTGSIGLEDDTDAHKKLKGLVQTRAPKEPEAKFHYETRADGEKILVED